MIIPLIIWVAIAFVALVILLWFFPVTLWFQAILSGVHIPLIQLVLMRWRGVNPNTIVIAMITGTKAGLKLKANELEAHYLAKGNVVKVVNALISADKPILPSISRPLPALTSQDETYSRQYRCLSILKSSILLL